MTSTRVITAATLAVLGCLIAVAVALSTGPSTTPVVPSHLVVGAGPPSTMTGIVRYTDSSGISITATVRANLVADTAQVDVTAKVSVVSASVTLRGVGDDVFLQVPDYASLLGAPWTEVHAPHDANAFGILAAELRHPDLARLHPTTERTTPHRTGPTITLRFDRVTLPQLEGVPLRLPSYGHLVCIVREGTTGQVLAVTIHLWNPADSVRASFLVTGYDQPVMLAAPPRTQVKVLDRARATSIFGNNAPRLARTLRRIGISGF